MVKRVRFVLRDSVRRIRRTWVRGLIGLFIAVFMVNAVGQILKLAESYRELCRNTEINANFVDTFRLKDILELESLGFGDEIYYEKEKMAEWNGAYETVVITNDIARYTGEDVDITFADGWDETSLDWRNCGGDVILISKFIQEIMGITLGDTIRLVPDIIRPQIEHNYYLKYIAETENSDITIAEAVEFYREEIEEKLSKAGIEYTVIGSIDFKSDIYSDIFFTPGSETAGITGPGTDLDIVQLQLGDYTRVNELREYGEAAADESNGKFIMDTEKLDDLMRSLDLIEILYPIAVVVALVIGMFGAFLLISQNVKIAAIMRIQGMSKGAATLSFVFEQALICAVGLAIGVLILVFFAGIGYSTITYCVYFCVMYLAAVLIASVAGACVILRKSPIELLQTKE